MEFKIDGRFPRVLNGVPRENSEGPPKGAARPDGDLQYSPEGLHEFLRDLPWGSNTHDTSRLSHRSVFLLMYWTRSRAPAPALLRGAGRLALLRRCGPYIGGGPYIVSYRMVHLCLIAIVRVKSYYTGTVLTKNVHYQF